MILTGEQWFGEKRICLVTRCVHFLECPQIRVFTAFVSFPFFRTWPAISAVFLERLLYLPLLFQKQFCLSDMVDGDWNGAGEISYYFAYQKTKFFPGNNITYTISLYLEITNTCLLLNHSGNLGNLLPPVLSNPPTLSQLSWRSSRGIRKNFYIYPLINSCFLIFFWN